MASILVRNIKSLVGVRVSGINMVKGAEMRTLPTIENSWLLIENGLVNSYGPNSVAPERADEVINGSGRFVFPCWCDSHTHIVYAGSREGEFVDKINGLE